ncbi:MAG: 30S ribosomal protein S7 [Candidatus Aenigmarchaeota archaeon]|nr:30S ribosomal protein S7 [Candidatus Aenigmarchaeota archaeon]
MMKEKRPAKRRTKKQGIEKREKTKFTGMKLFGRWDSNFELMDLGMKNYINIEPRLLPRSAGTHRNRFHKSRMHVVERLALHMMISGHAGKKHKLTSGKFGGSFSTALEIVEKALDILEKKEKKNPVEILVRAIENSALREEIMTYQLGSIVAREAVVTAPQRRVDKTLRFFAQAAYRSAFNKKKRTHEALADEIYAAYKGSTDSYAVKEKDRVEREAGGAR